MFKNRQQILIVVAVFALTFVFDSSVLLASSQSAKQASVKKKKSYVPKVLTRQERLTRQEKSKLMLQHIRLMQELKQFFIKKRNRIYLTADR